MNLTNSEVQALESAPHFGFTSFSGALVSTRDAQGNPRDLYKYLGVYFYTTDQLPKVTSFVLGEIRSYVHTLAPLMLTHSELIQLSNCQLHIGS